MDMKLMKTRLTIGADPEFCLAQESGGRAIRACDAGLLFDSDFGVDGCSSTGELRPHYGPTSVILTANIRKLIKSGLETSSRRQINQYIFLAGHYKHGMSLGGHIWLQGFTFDQHVLGKKLDLVLGELSNGIDNLAERERRKSAGYGKGWRCDKGPNAIEYRAPGSWLLNPHVTFLNLWVAEAVAYQYMDKVEKPFEKMTSFTNPHDKIVAFASAVENVPNKPLFLKVCELVFPQCPLNWEADFKGNWI